MGRRSQPGLPLAAREARRSDSARRPGQPERHWRHQGYACAEAAGDILVELDDDDLLSSDCLQEIVDAFDSNPEVGFVYSDTAQIQEDGRRCEDRFASAFGWRHYDDQVDGREVLVCRALPPTPHNVSYIWYAPNHVRAFRRTSTRRSAGTTSRSTSPTTPISWLGCTR
ncbi:glycosyltransferase [Micromonospora sp. M12]